VAGPVPVVAIGGITTTQRAADAIRAGAAAVAVISAVSAAADMRAAVRDLVHALGIS
jgi:thiamine-phosphate pyrophosphorylase